MRPIFGEQTSRILEPSPQGLISSVLNGPTAKGCPKKDHFNAENAFYALGYVTLLLKFR